ncbi:MAG: peptidoglycan bridge formation glycyltransferase FemA/FemB family protein [Candidatus Omnitrophica bacterium]|nr:peptidoglycan bridge formation glycyltransferase FemA/FemB family protein [Candidatus Omnitrophota bacterium]
MRFLIKYAYDKDEEAWNTFVSSEPTGTTPYHYYQWRRVIRDTYGLTSKYIFVEDASGEIKGILPLFFASLGVFSVGVALPYCSHGGIASDGHHIRMILLDTARSICQEMKLRYIELREVSSLSDRQGLVTQILKLERSIPQQWKKIESRCRRAVRKAEGNGLKVIEGGMEYVKRFYKIYQQNMTRLGVPFHSIRMFVKVMEAFGENAVLLMVKKNDEIIAGMLVVKSGCVAYDPWVSSLHSFNRLFPNDLLYWKAICYAIHNSCHIFDFGKGKIDTGLYCFKKKWRTVDIPLQYTRILLSGQIQIKRNELNTVQYIFNNIWSKMPNEINRHVGAYIRKYML